MKTTSALLSRERFRSEPSIEPVAEMVERHARDLEVRSSNSATGSNFPFEIFVTQGISYKFVFTYQFDLKTGNSNTFHTETSMDKTPTPNKV